MFAWNMNFYSLNISYVYVFGRRMIWLLLRDCRAAAVTADSATAGAQVRCCCRWKIGKCSVIRTASFHLTFSHIVNISLDALLNLTSRFTKHTNKLRK